MAFFVGVIITSLVQGSPIIGVFSLPAEDRSGEYIPASYVKWLESGTSRHPPAAFQKLIHVFSKAGARVVRMAHETPEVELQRLFKSLNGILYIGGSGEPSHSNRYMYVYI